MNAKFLVFAFCVCATAYASGCRADNTSLPFVSPLFTDNMVLQRGTPDRVWGWSAPGSKIVVTVAGKSAKTTANSGGEWLAVLPLLPVGGPYELTVTGPQSETFKNVLVGDVWLCSGQSNMEFGIGNTKNAQAEIANADHPQIRLFMVGHSIAVTPQKVASGQWVTCAPETVVQGGWSGFSAVGYFFGRELNQKLNVPIGLIESNWGGTPAESWTSEQALKTMPDFAPQLAGLDKTEVPGYDFTPIMDSWNRQNDPGIVAAPNWADLAYTDSDWKSMPLPQYWGGADSPNLANFLGLVWYRKEVDLPADVAGKSAVLHLGPVDDNDTTFVNGVQVGATIGWQAPREYPVPANLLVAGRSVIAVRVFNVAGGGGIYGKQEDMHMDVSGTSPISLAGAWKYKISVSLAQATPYPEDYTRSATNPAVLYNGMINPLTPFNIKGAIWYQGEANSGRAEQYRKLLPLMIGDWRSRWNEGDFPFYIVQLAGHRPVEFPDLREAQWETAQTVPNSGIATAIDIGDLNNVHPTDKQDVGHRLALVALAKTYGEDIEYSGPVYQSMKIDGNSIRLSFSHIAGGLVAKDNLPLKAFEIAGADGQFVPAEAKIDGEAVVVSTDAVPHPLAVRYDWAGFPASSLYNKAGLPCFPFRTDLPGNASHLAPLAVSAH